MVPIPISIEPFVITALICLAMLFLDLTELFNGVDKKQQLIKALKNFFRLLLQAYTFIGLLITIKYIGLVHNIDFHEVYTIGCQILYFALVGIVFERFKRCYLARCSVVFRMLLERLQVYMDRWIQSGKTEMGRDGSREHRKR